MVLSGSGRWCDPVDSVECMTWRDRSSRCWSMGKRGGKKVFFWGGVLDPVDDQSTGINIDYRPDMVSTG